MKRVKDILRSPRFMREVSLLLVFFAGLSGLVGLLLFLSAPGNPEVLAVAVGGLVETIIYTVLAVLIRRGSIKALWISGIWFSLDFLLLLTQPLSSGLAVALFSRVALIGFLVRYIRRERVSG